MPYHCFKGHGTYEDRMEMLRNIVDLVEASLFSDNPEWRLFILLCLSAIFLVFLDPDSGITNDSAYSSVLMSRLRKIFSSLMLLQRDSL